MDCRVKPGNDKAGMFCVARSPEVSEKLRRVGLDFGSFGKFRDCALLIVNEQE